MTNNYEDLDHPDMAHEELAPPHRSFMGNLAEAWRTRPLFKLIALITVIGGVGAASLGLFSGSNHSNSNAKLPKPPNMHEAPGGEASPYFVEQTKEAEQQRTQQAIATGGSALPTPIGQNPNVEMGSNNGKNDPLNELRAEQDRLKQQLVQVQQQQQQTQQKPQQQQQFDDSLAQAMQKELQQLMEGWKPSTIKQVSVSKDKEGSGGSGENGNGTSAGGSSAAAQGIPNAPPPGSGQQLPVIVPAGTVSYGQLLTEANSDVPGPILAQILSGPLSGARAVGGFHTVNDYNVLQFSIVNFKGKDFTVNAVALDPNMLVPGMATEVDERYFTRVVLPAAAGFVQGMGSAIGQGSSSLTTNGTTTIVSQSSQGIHQGIYEGLAQGAQTVGQFLQNQANNTQPLIRVAAGTPIGIFFVSSVQDTNNYAQPFGYGTQGVGYVGYPSGYPGYPGVGGVAAGTPGYPGVPGTPGYPGAPGYPAGTGYTSSYPGVPGGTLPPGYSPGYNGTNPQVPGYGAPTPNVPYPSALSSTSSGGSATSGTTPLYYGH